MKVVNVSNGSYKLIIQKGGEITLDAAYDGSTPGVVRITGDLIVEGNTTTVQSETLTIRDNIIVVNAGETGAGVTLDTAGLRVDRGSLNDASLLFNENVNHRNAVGASVAGTFTFVNDTGALVGIQTPSINTNGQNLYLINAAGAGVVTVTGTSDYERNVFNYANYVLNPPTGPLTINDADALPNAQALADYVDARLVFFDDYSISEGDTSVECIDKDTENFYRNILNPSYTLPATSKVSFKVDGSERGSFTTGGLTVDNINIFTNTINNTSNNLIFTASVSSIVEVNAVFQLDDTGLSPSAVSNATKIYTVNSNTTPAPGKTGIYFINQGNSDELVAKNRALLFSILF